MNMQVTMLSKMIRAYLLIGLTSYVIIFLYWLNSVNFYNVLNVTTFLSYVYLLWICVDKDEEYFSNRRLWLTIFVYSIVFVSLYLLLSYYYNGNTFLFSYQDAKMYERYSFRMKDMGFTDAVSYISKIWGFDDWGAPMSMALILKFVPSKLFVNFCYVVMNAASGLLLYGIGKMIKMSKKYAYMAALSYSIASYSMFVMGSFLKEEIFLLLIIASMWGLYKYRDTSKIEYLMFGGVVSVFVIFFRVPVAIFIWLSYAAMLLLSDGSHVKKTLFFLIGVIASFVVVGLFQYSSSRYANDGDITSVATYASSSLFQKTIGYASVLIGPFPTMYHLSGTTVKYRAVLGAGVLFKFLLFLPYWKGFILCLKTKVKELYPLYVFTIFNMLGLMVVLKINFRFALIGIPFFILLAFWYMDKYDGDANEEVRATPYYYWTNMELRVSLIVVFMITLAWNVMVREQSSDGIYIEHLKLLPPF